MYVACIGYVVHIWLTYVLTDEFPELVLVMAEENWIRGYHQALTDVEEGEKIAEEQKQLNKVDATISK